MEYEKVDFNDLIKGQKYKIKKKNYETTGTFWEYKSFKHTHAYFYERYDELVKSSYPHHWEYYRIIPKEEYHAKLKINFKVFQKTRPNDLKKGQLYKVDGFDSFFFMKLGQSAVFRRMILYDNRWVYDNSKHDEIYYYRYVSEEEYRKKRRDKFNENVLKIILNRLIDGFMWI